MLSCVGPDLPELDWILFFIILGLIIVVGLAFSLGYVLGLEKGEKKNLIKRKINKVKTAS